MSEDAVLGEICHIHAASDHGPRPNPALTNAERNSYDNLIVLCAHHHTLIDDQHQDYPADLIKRWKRDHEQKHHDARRAAQWQENSQQHAFVVVQSDQQIGEQLDHLIKGCFLNGYPQLANARRLALSVTKTELTGGSSVARARALAWCARLLLKEDGAARARDLLARSKELGETEEALIAEAFIVAEEAKSSLPALSILAPLETPLSTSAMLRIVGMEKGEAASLQWVQEAGLAFDSFDSDGKLVLIMTEQALDRWDEAFAHVALLAPPDFERTPVLSHVAAQACLAQALPVELRAQAPFHLPFDGRRVPLSDDPEALKHRRQAIEFYDLLEATAIQFGVPKAASIAADMALWLRLRDAEFQPQALETLRDSMRDDAILLRRLPLALEFGLEVDLSAVERRVDQRVALTGKGTVDEALARLALTLRQADPATAVPYLNVHRAQLSEFVGSSTLAGIETELLCRSGQVEAAKTVLADAAHLAFAEHDLDRLRRMIAEAEGADPVAERRRLYERTGDARDLASLINFLEKTKAWNDLAPYAQALFDKTHSAEDALRFARVLTRSGKRRDALRFLETIPAIVLLDDELQSLHAWALYHDGQLRRALEVLEPLRARRDAVNDYELFVNLAIASGHWDRLVECTNREWDLRERRSPERLLRAGQLAHSVNAPHARELIVAATHAAPDDPAILASAYFQATQAGWEHDSAVGDWLLRAGELSGDDGPLKSMSMEDLIELQPDSERRQQDAYTALKAGTISIAGAAGAMHQSISEICLRAAANCDEPDARKRASIFAYSGARPAVLKVSPGRVALDLTAIFTFSQLDVLPSVLAGFERVLIPDRLLVWLFQERQHVVFHQPSQVRSAHLFRRLVEQGVLRVLAAPVPSDLGFAKDVGFDLATMLEAAAGSPQQAYVIRPAPVFKLGSLRQEPVDLAHHEARLCSCQSLVDALRLHARITATESQHASAYLKLREHRWPNEPQIQRGSTLYLDDLAVAYLKEAKVLDRLKGAGYTVFISKSLHEQNAQLVAIESLASVQLAEIERIRVLLASAIEQGRVELISSDGGDGGSSSLQAQLNFLDTDREVDAFVVDDRFVNRFLHISRADQATPILTSLDVVEHLIEARRISVDDGWEHRTNLRRFGYTFVPVHEHELAHHLLHAPLLGGVLTETAELKAIREAARLLQLREVLQAPHELTWLTQYKTALLKTVRLVWGQERDAASAIARCEWILGQLDMRGWAFAFDPASLPGFVVDSHAAMLHALCFASLDLLDKTNRAYHQWIESHFLQPVKQTEPEVFEKLVALAANLLDDIVKREPENYLD